MTSVLNSSTSSWEQAESLQPLHANGDLLIRFNVPFVVVVYGWHHGWRWATTKWLAGWYEVASRLQLDNANPAAEEPRPFPCYDEDFSERSPEDAPPPTRTTAAMCCSEAG